MILSACEYTRIHRLVYHVLLFATSFVLYFEGLSSTIEVYSLYFAVRKKERTQRERERIGKRDIVANNIDIEKREVERERTIAAHYIRTYASPFLAVSLSLSLSLFLYSLLPSLSIQKKLNCPYSMKCAYTILSIIFAAFEYQR